MGGFSRANWCGSSECEDGIKDKTGAEVRGTLYGKKEKVFGKCIYCGNSAKFVIYIAKSY
jgi:prolyl-tRNA synthetase